MSTITTIWSEYWWIVPLLLLLLCIIGCIRGRKRWTACGCCGSADAIDRGGER